MRLFVAGALLLGGCGLTGQPPVQRSALPVERALGPERLPCGPRRAVLELLAAASAQRPVAQALAQAGGLIAQTSVFEILADADGSHWSAILTAPNGVTCLLAAGEAWQASPELRIAYPPAGTDPPSPRSE